MNIKKRNILLFTLSSLLLATGVSLKTKEQKVEGGPRPTNINMSTLSQEGIDNYYSRKGGFTNKRGDALLGELHEVIKDHIEYNYESNTDRYVFKIIDRNWDLSPLTPAQLKNFNYANDMPYIHKLYADYNHDTTKAYLFYSEELKRTSFDKEHIWAQSLGDFGRNYGAGSDFHALWPSDIKGNQQAHSNYNFGTPQTSITSVNNDRGTYVGRNGYIPGQPNKVFEPLLEYRGDIARAMMYMAARYYVWEDDEHPKLKLVNGSPAATKASPTNPGLAGNLTTLLEWHEADPVSPYEIKRNNLLYYNYQQNRNPFIDRPEWARIAFDTSYVGGGASSSGGTSSSTEELLSISVSGAPATLKLGEDYSWDNLTFTAHYKEAGNTAINKENPNLTVDYPDTSKLGEQTLNVGFTYGDFTRYASVNVFITNEDVNVGEGGDPATDLFISEYIEGNSNNKGLEIYNGTGNTVNLSSYDIRLYSNGRKLEQGASNTLALSGTLADGATYSVVHTSAVQALKDVATVINGGVTGFNGDDAIGLYKNGVLIDLIGIIGEQVKWGGTGANGVSGTVENKTLVRASHITSPNTTFIFSEWNVYPVDTFTYFGSHEMEDVFLGVSKEEQSAAWAKYFLDVTSSYCEEGEGYNLAGTLWNTLAAEYNYMDTSSKALFKSAIPNGDNTTDITGAKARYELLINSYPALYANNFMVDGSNDVIFDSPTELTKAPLTNGIILLSVLSIITLLGYFFLNKKKITV